MGEAQALVVEDDPVLDSDFGKEMVRQMRAVDTYGTYDDWSAARILAPFVVTKEMRKEIPIIGDPDEVTLSRVKAYYNALAATIEARCGLMAVPMIQLSHEGFGRALITVGKLVVIDRTLRDVHRFGFADLEKMRSEAEKWVNKAVELIEAYPQVAGE
ncbi:MAG: NifX-associated nitrogen fixation protein [Pseudomonadota bacterium]|nr:NifX-associated nitrogen fixation protein [Pseudomonadota bacterium]